jgi:hypothetical protein
LRCRARHHAARRLQQPWRAASGCAAIRASSCSNQGRRAAPDRLATCSRSLDPGDRGGVELPRLHGALAARRQEQCEQHGVQLAGAVHARQSIGGVALGDERQGCGVGVVGHGRSRWIGMGVQRAC